MTVVFDRHDDVVARRGSVASRHDLIIEVLVPRGDEQSTPARHGVSSVEHQVHENLHELGYVAGRRRQRVCPVDDDADRVGHRVAGVRDEIVEQGVDHHDVTTTLDPACEGEHLAHHLRPALDRGLERRKQFEPVGVVLVLREQLRRHQNRGQHVVEVVGDASCEGSEALHALGTGTRLLLFAVGGDVGVDAQNRLRLSALVMHELPPAVGDDRTPGDRALHELTCPEPFAQHFIGRVVKLVEIVVHQLGHRAADRLGGGHLIELGRRSVPVLHPVIEAADDDGVSRDVQQHCLLFEAPRDLALAVVRRHLGRRIAHVHHDAGLDGVDRDVDPAFGELDPFPMNHPVSRPCRLPERILERGSHHVGIRGPQVSSDQVVSRAPEQVLSRRIHERDQPVGVEKEQSIRDGS